MLSTNTFLRPFRAACALCLLALHPSLRAEEIPLIFTVGTTTASVAGAAWGYVTWWSTDPSEWPTGPFALYAKAGEADSAALYERLATIRPRTDPQALRAIIARGVDLGFPEAELQTQLDAFFDAYIPGSFLSLTERLSVLAIAGEAQPELRETLSTLARVSPAAAMAMGRAHTFSLAHGEVRTIEVRICRDGDGGDCTVVLGRVTVQGGHPVVLPAPGAPMHVPFRGGAHAAALDEPDEGDPEHGLDPVDPRSDLNVPLRWGLTPDLAEAALLHGGFDLFRLDAALALAAGFAGPDAQAPTPAAMEMLLLGFPDQARRVNRLPLFMAETLTAEEAADRFHLPELFFTVDDNDRFDEGNAAFEDGDTFYYYVGARDLLGRLGDLSIGTEVVVCSRLPSNGPEETQVRNHYQFSEATGRSDQFFEVSWTPVVSERGRPIREYRIYRWNHPEEMLLNAGSPRTEATVGGVGGLVGVVPGDQTVFFDDGDDSPRLVYLRDPDGGPGAVVQDDGNRVHWYTVRAVEETACGGLISFNGPLASGVIRDRVGPGAGTGWLEPAWFELEANWDNATVSPLSPLPLEEQDPAIINLRIEAVRAHPAFAYVDLWCAQLRAGRRHLGRMVFPDGVHEIARDFRIPALESSTQPGQFPLNVVAVFGTANGETAPPVTPNTVLTPSAVLTQRVTFKLSATRVRHQGEGGEFHQPRDVFRQFDLGLPEFGPLRVAFDPPDETTEWRLYRRVDQGPLVMVANGLGRAPVGEVMDYKDHAVPLAGGRLCYFLQAFDIHGNPGPMTLIGCQKVLPSSDLDEDPLPRPMLHEAEMLGTVHGEAAARLTWFCPPPGVAYFRVRIASSDGPPSLDFSADLEAMPFYGPDLGLAADMSLDDLSVDALGFRIYRTFPVASSALGAGPDFSVILGPALPPGRTYRVTVQAVDASGRSGPRSNEIEFIWFERTPTAIPPIESLDCRVGWPARTPADAVDPLVLAANPEGPVLHARVNIDAVAIDGLLRPIEGGAVCVGMVDFSHFFPPTDPIWREPPNKSSLPQDGFVLPGSGVGIAEYFFTRLDGSPLLPLALYRTQVAAPATGWNQVGGDIAQVSPLIEAIAYQRVNVKDGAGNVVGEGLHVRDPYLFLHQPDEFLGTQVYLLYLRDTQPMVTSSGYRYLVADYSADGALLHVFHLPTVLAP